MKCSPVVIFWILHDTSNAPRHSHHVNKQAVPNATPNNNTRTPERSPRSPLRRSNSNTNGDNIANAPTHNCQNGKPAPVHNTHHANTCNTANQTAPTFRIGATSGNKHHRNKRTSTAKTMSFDSIIP
ncbi:hypothetical protein Ga0100231_019880 [Opitutaceae bacterium TAV4]|nr:hypothetical protein Ga0100231_019880 [Opitutaceae bacterium TAV4]RRK00325.1 hypothetical protein Ga0100230_020645 [Opitutaceae bacterium TAV3]